MEYATSSKIVRGSPARSGKRSPLDQKPDLLKSPVPDAREQAPHDKRYQPAGRSLSPMKSFLHKTAIALENLWDKFRRNRIRGTPVIDPYLGYSTPGGVIVRGRVLAKRERLDNALRRVPLRKFRNALQMAALFSSAEIPGLTVRAGDVAAISDEEGYFSLAVPATGNGWIEIAASIEGIEEAVSLPAMITHPDAEFGVISDIDDTLIRTDAWSLYRNAYTTLTGDPLSRTVFPDAVDLLERLHAGVNPVFYVSSSPWNLHGFLVEVFRHNGLVRGPMFLRDLGIAESVFIKGSHGTHKGAGIDTVLAANPTLTFVLIGDTGQHDAEVYGEAIRRHPQRIRQVILRQAGPVIDAQDREWARAIEETGVPFTSSPDYSEIEI